MPNSSGWLQEIQYFRAISIIEVIVWHVIPIALLGLPHLQFLQNALPTPQKDLLIAFAALTAFGVPHFIFISGVVLYHKYSGGVHLPTFYKKRFSSVLPPYLVWTTFYYFYQILVVGTLYSALFQQATAYSLTISLRGFVDALALGRWQMWFILLIMELYLLFPFLVKLYSRFSRQKNAIYLLLFILLVPVVLNINGVPYVSNLLLYTFYFVFGFFVAEHYVAIMQKVRSVRLSRISIVVVLSTVCYAVLFYNAFWVPNTSPVPPQHIWLYNIAGPFYCLLLIGFYLRLGAEWREPHGFFTRYLEKIGEDSFGIYLTHTLFITVFAFFLIWVGLGPNNLLFYPTLVFLTLISSYWSVRGLYRLPFSRIVIGKPRKKESKPPQLS